MNSVEITPQMVKLAQERCRLSGSDLRQELARQVVQTAVLNLDPENDLLIDEQNAFSNDDLLVAAFNVNDLLINDLRFDIRFKGEDDRCAFPRHLLFGQYLACGTLVVRFNGDATADVIAYLPFKDWQLQDKHETNEERLLLRPRTDSLDLDQTIKAALADYKPVAYPVLPVVGAKEITDFIAAPADLSLADKRTLVEAVLTHPQSWPLLKDILATYSKAAFKKTLVHAAKWNQTLEKLVQLVEPKFANLSKDDIRNIIAGTGEVLGSQAQSPKFRQEFLRRLTEVQLAKKLKGEQLVNATKAAEQIIAGSSASVTLQSTVKSKTVFDIAMLVKKQRQKFQHFVSASAEELSAAFSKAALQPVYATHSQESNEGLEAINEALVLIDACEIATEIKELEADLAQL
ncbi:MAG: hypothetical protein K2W82_05125 [Candidatus Obscuribacterales bacterium]|nr:hypothetical protein [Candidatus Obscuribacterales bacterium]